ncbi:Beta-galactosidase 8 [Camellia lanceoleosa]|uniref:Beta-galactosidase 8 n=1 Tax=Camellia lanceoleosa TaxID=1840588 RepID=A0ACC0GXN3_9ERIC|nr:Beta-galactosidase 8 [Camellia lanceoleosa]
MWTENWTGWFLSFGGAVPYEPVEDIAFDVARFFQRGGTFQNYYMYHGGTNFGRTTGGPFIATNYDYDAPIDEYGLLRQPKWGHLKDVHKAIKLCEPAMVATGPIITSLGPNLEINSVATIPQFTCQSLNDNVGVSEAFLSGWSWFNEPVGISSNNAFMQLGLAEQINTTADKSDYLWYSLSTNSQGGSQTVLHVESLGHVLHAFIIGKLAGSGEGNRGNAKVAIEVPITLVPGKNRIDLLSLTVGLQNYGAFFDKWGARVTGPVKLKGLNNGSTIDLSSQQWTYQTGLKGEELGLSSGGSSVWVSKPILPKNQPLIWYKVILCTFFFAYNLAKLKESLL